MTLILALVLHLGAWTGPSLPAAAAASAVYQLTVRGTPHAHAVLRATGLPKGWVASFCTKQFCSPFGYDAQLDSRGSAVIELAFIRVDDAAPAHAAAVISAPGARPVRIRLRVRPRVNAR